MEPLLFTPLSLLETNALYNYALERINNSPLTIFKKSFVLTTQQVQRKESEDNANTAAGSGTANECRESREK